MKQLNIWKTSFYTMLAIAAGAFTACVDDDVDKQAPTLELSEEAVAFTGTATEDATVTVRSNRQWTVAYEDEETQKEWMYFKVSGNEVSEGIYNGDGTVKITVGESAQPHMGRLIFTLSNSYGELYRKYLTVTQGQLRSPDGRRRRQTGRVYSGQQRPERRRRLGQGHAAPIQRVDDRGGHPGQRRGGQQQPQTLRGRQQRPRTVGHRSLRCRFRHGQRPRNEVSRRP